MAKRDTRAQSAPTVATRLSFSYVGSDVQLDSQQSLEMRTPPSHSVEAMEETLGFWYELRDSSGQTLYRRITDNPIRFSVEVRTDDPDRPLAWQAIEAPRGSFVLLVPELPAAETIILFSSPLGRDGVLEPAQELARFDLRDRG